jgi:hypothetical protein
MSRNFSLKLFSHVWTRDAATKHEGSPKSHFPNFIEFPPLSPRAISLKLSRHDKALPRMGDQISPCQRSRRFLMVCGLAQLLLDGLIFSGMYIKRFIKTLDPSRLQASDFLTCHIWTGLKSILPRKTYYVVSLIPPGTHGFVYYHPPTSECDEVRFRVTGGSDSASFSSGRDGKRHASRWSALSMRSYQRAPVPSDNIVTQCYVFIEFLPYVDWDQVLTLARLIAIQSRL